MLARSSFDYAIVRVVPRVERGECVNAGAIVFCRTRRFLGARIDLDARRLAGYRRPIASIGWSRHAAR
jgi:hypothetical protein